MSTELEVIHKHQNIHIYENGMERACILDEVHLVGEVEFSEELSTEDV